MISKVSRAQMRQKKHRRLRNHIVGIDPFMTLSFMSLPVIPKLRLTTRGIIDVARQQYI